MSNHRAQFTLMAAVCALLLWLGGPASAAPDHDFVGAKKCSMCHKKADVGEQYKIWEKSRHAHAYDTLGTPEAKKVGASMGIDDPQKSGKCLKCHSTAYYFTENVVSNDIDVSEGVSCESCHGPGNDYYKKSVMEDQAKAMKNGLIIPDQKTCVKCHNSESPSYKSFDFSKFWEKIKHDIPK